jgi:hypothetical protein
MVGPEASARSQSFVGSVAIMKRRVNPVLGQRPLCQLSITPDTGKGAR